MQTMNDLQAKSTNTLVLCPFCGGEASTLHRPHVIDWRYSVGCNDDECRGFIGLSWLYKTEAEAIAAWNTRAERTCKQEERGWGTEGDHARVWLTCGHDCMVPTVQDLPNYCPNCGAPKRGAVCDYCGTHFGRYQGQASIEVEPELITIYSWDGSMVYQVLNDYHVTVKVVGE